MGVVKSVTGHQKVRDALCWLGAQYIRFVYATGRWDVVGSEWPVACWDRNEPFILAFWHGRILMMPYCWRPTVPINMLISQHRDGQIIARTVSHFGINTLVGSSSRGGATALRAMVKLLKSGQCVGITPDGPRGPRMRAAPGIAQVARLSGMPVIPCTFATRRHRLLGSWDRFMVALPFSRGIFVWGAPIRAADERAVAAGGLAAVIEDSLNAITRLADQRMGLAPVQPADPAMATL